MPIEFLSEETKGARRNVLFRFQRKRKRNDDGQKRDKYHQDEIRDKQSLRPDAFYAFAAFAASQDNAV